MSQNKKGFHGGLLGGLVKSFFLIGITIIPTSQLAAPSKSEAFKLSVFCF